MENVSVEQLEAVSGGVGCIGGTMKCPECGSKDIKATEYKLTGGHGHKGSSHKWVPPYDIGRGSFCQLFLYGFMRFLGYAHKSVHRVIVSIS